MPRYYLNVRLAHALVSDVSGRECADLEEAICLAKCLLRGMKLPRATPPLYIPRVEIADRHGVMATVPRLPPNMPLPGAGRA
jgi:hypothetical protein